MKTAFWLSSWIWIASAAAGDLSGRWVYTEGQQTAGLLLRHDPRAGRFSGTFSLLGMDLPVEGRADSASFVVERMGGVPLASQGRSMTGRLQQDMLAVRIANPGEDTVTMPMRREGGAQAGPAEVEIAPQRAGAAGSAEFGGRWEAANDDKTFVEIVEIATAGNNLRGTIQGLERGYFSGKVKVAHAYQFQGAIQGATAAIRIWDAQGSASAATNAILERRAEYLIVRVGDQESPYARPGVPLVRSAEGSAEAARLGQAIAGRVFQTTSQAHGRPGFAGGRMKAAFCSDGAMQYDVSNLASTGGMYGQAVDMGSTVTRRGVWRIVLRGGKPVVRAEWRGTGTSYSLTDYFIVTPEQDGRSARINGVELPATGGC